MPNLLLPILPSQLPAGYCFTSWQATLNDFSAAQNALLPGSTFYNFGPDVPAPEFEAFPWLRSIDMRWYVFDGNWISPNPETSADVRRLFVGNPATIAAYDGGDSGAASDRSGPMWEIDPQFADFIPIGVGTIVPTVATTGGAKQATLSLANFYHWHGVGTDGAPGGNDPPVMISRAWSTNPTTFVERFQD